MYARLNQLARHLSRPLPNYLHNASPRLSSLAARAMASERSKRTINTAACLIIGDEVLGGKVTTPYQAGQQALKAETVDDLDSRHQLGLVCTIL